MKIRLTIVLVLIIFQLFAQKDSKQLVNVIGETTWRDFFTASTFIPNCYSSERVRKLVPKTEKYRPIKISEIDFNRLSAYDHFVHSFYYPEWYFQSCSMFGYAENLLETIPAHLKRQGEGLAMSKRQRKAIYQNRDSTIILLKECIEDRNTVINDDFKRAIINLKMFELIPTLVAIVQKQLEIKDPYIVTMLCLLMRFDFDPFINSEIHKQLYPPDTSDIYFFSGAKYKNSVPFTNENYKKIVNWAEAYYELASNKQSDFVKIQSRICELGEKGHSINPRRKVDIQPFQISRYEITNKQFQMFVKSTDYITLAEKHKDGFVFRLGLDEFEWVQDSTANWKYPNGVSKGGINDKMNHPVTCISYIDAMAYCAWGKVRLPTIEEWEVASRGNTSNTTHYFGDSLNLIYKHANVWHGKTHLMKYENEDYLTTSPVGNFQPNPFGIYDVYGNVFEFCLNIPKTFKDLNNVAASRGGSWWCSMHACGFFNSIDIGRVQKEASFSNNGFRVVR